MAQNPLKECTTCGKTWKRRTADDETMCPYCGSTNVRDARMADRPTASRRGGCGGRLAALALLLALGGGGAYWYFKVYTASPRQAAPAETPAPPAAPSPEPDPEPAPPTVEPPQVEAEPADALEPVRAELSEVAEAIADARRTPWWAQPGSPARATFTAAVQRRLDAVRERMQDDEAVAAAVDALRDWLVAQTDADADTARAAFHERIAELGGPGVATVDDDAPADDPDTASRELFSLAVNYRNAGRLDLARQQLQRIVALGVSPWAQRAQTMLDELDAQTP